MIATQHTLRRTAPPPRAAVIGNRTVAWDRQWLKHELRAAIAIETPILHYQPRLRLTTGELVANEALLLPGVFIPFVGQGDLIDLIGAWVLAEACREAACWNTARLSLNVSAQQLQSGTLPFQLTVALEQSGLPPDRLDLELTESSLVDSIDTLLALSAIRDLGIGLALEDFGTGFVSLSRLKRLPLTALKLDRSLVRELPTSRKDAAIIRTVIETGRAMRLTTMAEGIDTEDQRAFLSGIGCDEGQGDLFSHPLPSGQLRPMLDAARS